MPYRNPKILKLAQEAPHCMICGVGNYGQVVGCHSNSQKHGKGMGQKAHDLVVFACADCHSVLDGRTKSGMEREGLQTLFLEGVYKTVLWMLEEGHLKVGR